MDRDDLHQSGVGPHRMNPRGLKNFALFIFGLTLFLVVLFCSGIAAYFFYYIAYPHYYGGAKTFGGFAIGTIGAIVFSSLGWLFLKVQPKDSE
jgi:hypothetical protein